VLCQEHKTLLQPGDDMLMGSMCTWQINPEKMSSKQWHVFKEKSDARLYDRQTAPAVAL
jgi:hypothetical protein